MEACFGDVSVSAMLDSGATHNLTGDFSCLQNFHKLKNPTRLNVATKGSGAYISGIGELHFRATNGRIIPLTHFCYCEQAQSTLISLAALRKSSPQKRLSCLLTSNVKEVVCSSVQDAHQVSALETTMLPKRLQQFYLLIPLSNTSISIL
jgi:hypothetical protein